MTCFLNLVNRFIFAYIHHDWLFFQYIGKVCLKLLSKVTAKNGCLLETSFKQGLSNVVQRTVGHPPVTIPLRMVFHTVLSWKVLMVYQRGLCSQTMRDLTKSNECNKHSC